MTFADALITFLHILVFVYWLGGDLGAFFSSYTLIDGSKPLEARLTALKVLNNVDMAPRTSITLAFPTGLTLAAQKGWMTISPGFLFLVWAVALVWLAMVWRVHLKHLPPSAIERRVDMTIRYITAIGLIGFGIGTVAGMFDTVPWFIGVKCLLLAACIVAGLIVRRALVPLFTAVRAMIAEGPSAEGDRVMREVILFRSKPTVVTIWLLIMTATMIGLMTPV